MQTFSPVAHELLHIKPRKHNMYSHISKAVSDIIWAATARSQLTYWVNKLKPFSAQQSSVWGLKYKDKPLAFGPQDIIGGGGGFELVCLVLVTPSSFLRQWHCWDIHYRTLGWRPKCVLSPDVILYLLLGHCGNTSCWRSWLTIDPAICTSPCSTGAKDSSSLCSALLQYKDANTGVLFEECLFRQLSTSSMNNC